MMSLWKSWSTTFSKTGKSIQRKSSSRVVSYIENTIMLLETKHVSCFVCPFAKDDEEKDIYEWVIRQNIHLNSTFNIVNGKYV